MPRILRLFSPEERKLCGDIATFQYLKWTYMEVREEIFITRSNVFKLKKRGTLS